MRNDLVTVIIPAFNSEKYIEKCIDSVLNQSYCNIEIIVVNDGSTDGTVTKLAKYPEVTLLTKENGGLCSARNYGVKFVNGKYVIFLDSDDYLEKDFILNLYAESSGRDDELIMCDFLKDGKKESENCTYLELEGKDEIMSLFLRGGIYNRTVNKLYPYELIKNVSFATGRDMLEDAFFTSHVLEKTNKVIRIPYAGYNYIRHATSMTRTKLTKRQIASYYSNILEKDIVLSRYVPKKDYDFLSNKMFEHIKGCMLSVHNLDEYNIIEKINTGISFLYLNQPNNNDSCLITLLYGRTDKSQRSIKKAFRKYVFSCADLKTKKLYLKYIVRSILSTTFNK